VREKKRQGEKGTAVERKRLREKYGEKEDEREREKERER
jgi:hypothetical protein